MKTILLLIVLSALWFSPAKADNFNYTGATAEDENGIGYVGNSGSGGGLGGPAGNDRLGIAQEFNVLLDTQTSFLYVNATVNPYGVGTTTVNYDIYTQTGNKGGLIPLTSSLALTSQPLTFTVDQAQVNSGAMSTYNLQIPFNYDFQPGQYWIAEQGTGAPQVYLSQTYSDPPNNNTAQTPEPSLWVFFVMLTGLILYKGRKYAAMGRVV